MSLAAAAASTAFEGASVTFLAKVKGTYPFIDQVVGNKTAAFEGDPAAFLAHHGDNDANRRLLTNRIKKCAMCSKPNAFTLAQCNACGTSLVETPISFSNNVFMGFVFGIQKGPFPFTVSIRYQDADFLVMDDLLALAPLHFNVIPTSQYIPDWRYLLRKPAEGAALVGAMIERCELAAQPFLSNAAWCSKVLKPPHTFDLKNDIACGFNYPPSQYQLHIQYMMPNLLPFQYAQFLKGVHYTYKRFFPVSYVVECLKAATAAPLPATLLQDDTPIAAIVDYFAVQHGIDYDKIHTTFLANFKLLAAKYASWSTADFEGGIVDINGKPIFASATATSSEADADINAIVNNDKLALQNYGRPYADGKPTGSYYSFPKKSPADVTQW